MFRKLYKQLHKRIRLLHNKGREPYLSLSKILGFYPDNLQIYEQALLHKSSSVETGDGKWLNNERLEFLGDGILDAAVADIVYKRYPNKREGFLTNTRSKIVQRETMNKVAVQLGLDQMVVYSTKINSHNNHMYGNALEALIGAIYLDGGFANAKEFIHKFILNDIENKELFYDSKTTLQEIVQGQYEEDVHYVLVKEEGPDHNKSFFVEAMLGSKVLADHDGNPVFQSAIKLLGEQIGIGIGYSKKESQQAASKMAVKRLRTDKELQQRISATKKKKAGELTDEKEFSDLPEEETV